jgi:uncharacterized protein
MTPLRSSRTVDGMAAPPLAVTRSRSIALFLVVSFVWTWTLEIIGRSRQGGGHSIDNMGPWLILATFGPLAGALAAGQLDGGGVRALLRRFGPLRQRWATWLLAGYVLVPAAVVLAAVFSGGQIGKAVREIALLAFVPLVGLFSIIGGPLGEEFGWRGVFLPWLLQRRTPLVSAVIVGVIWAVWHAPLWTLDDFIPGLPAAVFIPLYIISLVAFSLVMTALALRSSGSIAVAMLAHGVFNSILLPFDALRDDGVLTASSAVPFTIATVLTAIVVALAGGLRARTAQD